MLHCSIDTDSVDYDVYFKLKSFKTDILYSSTYMYALNLKQEGTQQLTELRAASSHLSFYSAL